MGMFEGFVSLFAFGRVCVCLCCVCVCVWGVGGTGNCKPAQHGTEQEVGQRGIKGLLHHVLPLPAACMTLCTLCVFVYMCGCTCVCVRVCVTEKAGSLLPCCSNWLQSSTMVWHHQLERTIYLYLCVCVCVHVAYMCVFGLSQWGIC